MVTWVEVIPSVSQAYWLVGLAQWKGGLGAATPNKKTHGRYRSVDPSTEETSATSRSDLQMCPVVWMAAAMGHCFRHLFITIHHALQQPGSISRAAYLQGFPSSLQVMTYRVKAQWGILSPHLANFCSTQSHLQTSHLMYDLTFNRATAASPGRRHKADRLTHHIWGNARKAQRQEMGKDTERETLV